MSRQQGSSMGKGGREGNKSSGSTNISCRHAGQAARVSGGARAERRSQWPTLMKGIHRMKCGGMKRRLFTVACLTGVWRENDHKGCLWLLSLMLSISSHEPLDWKDLQVIRTIGLEKWFKRSLHMLSLWLKASDMMWKYEIWILFHKNCTLLPPKKVKLCDCNSSFSH